MSKKGVGSMRNAHPLFGKKGGAPHPSESDMYVCSLCNWSFSTQGRLKRHSESVHRQSAGFLVKYAANTFTGKTTWGET